MEAQCNIKRFTFCIPLVSDLCPTMKERWTRRRCFTSWSCPWRWPGWWSTWSRWWSSDGRNTGRCSTISWSSWPCPTSQSSSAAPSSSRCRRCGWPTPGRPTLTSYSICFRSCTSQSWFRFTQPFSSGNFLSFILTKVQPNFRDFNL